MWQTQQRYLIETKDITVHTIKKNNTVYHYMYAILSPRILELLNASLEDGFTGIAFSCYHYEKTCFLIANIVYDYIRKTSIGEGVIYKVVDYRGIRFFSIFHNMKLTRVSSYYGVRLAPALITDPKEIFITNRILFGVMKTGNDVFGQLEFLAKEMIKYIVDRMR